MVIADRSAYWGGGMDRDLAIRAINSSSSLRAAFVSNPHLLDMALKMLVDKFHAVEFRDVTSNDVFEALGITGRHAAVILALAQANRTDLTHEYLDQIINGTAPDIPLGLLKDLPELPVEKYEVAEKLNTKTFARAIVEIDDAVLKMIKLGKTALQSNPHLLKMAFKFKLPPIVQEHEELREWAKMRYNELLTKLACDPI